MVVFAGSMNTNHILHGLLFKQWVPRAGLGFSTRGRLHLEPNREGVLCKPDTAYQSPLLRGYDISTISYIVMPLHENQTPMWTYLETLMLNH